ncbi:alpha-(1,6)-fucosyltransferase [Lates japonicus]|uniref:Alpha-(1,6)-fucosyltransferase n=1 Tax=Lates japonicus TaxID=270547 RepID=A0AAD3RFZ7_LATJO|nr:alpha-(1,6)-fucosyltransferase [Lates japonicus]
MDVGVLLPREVTFVFSLAQPPARGFCQAGLSLKGPMPAHHQPYPSPLQSREAHDKDVQVVELPIVDSLHPRPPYLPLAIPEDLAPRLQRLHGDPSVWWVSQFVKYLVRPQAWLEKEIQQTTAKLGFKHPIIG